jgi:hypothetical protein
VTILVVARAGTPGSRYHDTAFAHKAHLPSNPKRMKALAEESLSVFSLESFEAGKQPHVFSQPSGTIEFAPIQKALWNTTALSVHCLASGDEHQGVVGLGSIEAKSYATTKTFTTEVFKEFTTHGR